MPPELPNNLRLNILENYEKSVKSQNFIELYNLVPSLPPKLKASFKTAEK